MSEVRGQPSETRVHPAVRRRNRISSTGRRVAGASRRDASRANKVSATARPRRDNRPVNARRVVVLVLDIVLLAGVVGYIMWQSWRSDASPEATPEATAARENGGTSAGKRKQAREVHRTLAKLERDPDALIAEASREKVGRHAREAVPRGSKVDPIQRTWNPDGTGGGTMTVKITPPGKPTVTYATLMVREPDGWKILATIPASSP